MNSPEYLPVPSDEERVDDLLALLPQELQERWETEVSTLPPADAVKRLEEVLAARTQFVTQGSVHFSTEAEHDPVLQKGLEHVVQELERSIGNTELFLGDGNVAEVYRLTYDPRICIKTVHNEVAYKNGNTIYQEGDFMDRLNGLVVSGVRTPKFYFYHDTPNQKSLVMETIDGSSLSKIVEGVVDFPEIRDISVDQFARSLREYVSAMHDLKIYHGDLFERNIMVERGTLLPRVIDFGKSKLAYFDEEIGNYGEADKFILTQSVRSLERFLKGEKVDLSK